MVGFKFNYHEVDDAEASIYGMNFSEVSNMIQEFNDYFETNYQTINEFNYGEDLRKIEIVEQESIGDKKIFNQIK